VMKSRGPRTALINTTRRNNGREIFITFDTERTV